MFSYVYAVDGPGPNLLYHASFFNDYTAWISNATALIHSTELSARIYIGIPRNKRHLIINSILKQGLFQYQQNPAQGATTRLRQKL